MVMAYNYSRDPIHPMILLGALFGYAYVYQPLYLHSTGLLSDYISEDSILFVHIVNCIGILALCIGTLTGTKSIDDLYEESGVSEPDPELQNRLITASYILAGIGIAGYMVQLSYSGGFAKAYSYVKGGGWAPSGYIGEAPMLTIPAILLYCIAREDKKFRPLDLLVLLIFDLPHLIQGSLGSRRGPLFFGLTVLFWGRFLTSYRRPGFKTVASTMLLVGVLVITVFAHRKQLYIGSDFEFSTAAVKEKLAPHEISKGNDYLVGCGQVINSHYHKKHFWGRRYLVMFFIRPIPKQIWPTKYEDMGFSGFAASNPNAFERNEWLASVGWTPLRGSATGCIADMYLEFSWGMVVIMFLIGRFFSYLWKQSILQRGIWLMLFIESIVFSVFLPTQSVSAWFYRFLLISLPSIVLWKTFVDKEWVQKTVKMRKNNDYPPWMNN
ncbi:hypothetical protein BVX94_02835 [bacterium B17]|nr:hypothetical protein BVX94_02835 [bacterium B17]